MTRNQRKRFEAKQYNLKYEFCKEKYGISFTPSWINHYVKWAELDFPDEIPWRI